MSEPELEAQPLPPAGASPGPPERAGPPPGATERTVPQGGPGGTEEGPAANARHTLWGHDPANVGLLAALVVIAVLLAGAIAGFPGAREFLITGLLLVLLLAGGAWQRRKR